MTSEITPAALPDGHPKKAYTGVDGTAYRILIPVRKIGIERVEGHADLLGSWTYSSWVEVNAYLDRAAKTAPKGGGYDKHPFEVSWADGQSYSGRYDLENYDSFQSLQAHIRRSLGFMVCDPRAGEIWSGEQRQLAAMYLETYDLGQPAVPAPEDWEILHDYRLGQRDFRELQTEAFRNAFGASETSPH